MESRTESKMRLADLLKRWLLWLDLAERSVLDATHHDVLAWLPDVGGDARRTYLGALSGFHRWLVVEGYRLENPVDKVPRPRPHKRLPKPISDEDAHHLWTVVLPEHRVTIGLAMLCGLRCQEICLSRWENVAWGEPTLLLVDRDGAKGGNERTVVVPAELAAVMRARRRRSGWLGRGPEGQGGTPELMSQYLRRLLRSYDVEASAHQLRHWWATTMLRRGASERVVQEGLGHATLATIHVYTEVTVADMAVVARDLRPR